MCPQGVAQRRHHDVTPSLRAGAAPVDTSGEGGGALSASTSLAGALGTGAISGALGARSSYVTSSLAARQKMTPA
jgi:hypothetical protein